MRPRLSADPVPASNAPRQPERARRLSATALVVEDSTSMRELLVHALRRIPGMKTMEACDGREALERIQETRPDIILTDINMPVMDGMTLIKRIRDDQELLGIPIVVLTTENNPHDRARAFALGATSFMTKPIRAPLVLDQVRRLLAL